MSVAVGAGIACVLALFAAVDVGTDEVSFALVSPGEQKSTRTNAVYIANKDLYRPLRKKRSSKCRNVWLFYLKCFILEPNIFFKCAHPYVV